MQEIYALYTKHNGQEEFIGCASSFRNLRKLLSSAIKAHVIMFHKPGLPIRFHEQIRFCRKELENMDLDQIDQCLRFGELREIGEEEAAELLQYDGKVIFTGPVAQAGIMECEALNALIIDPSRTQSQPFGDND